MLIRGGEVPEQNGRKPYPIEGYEVPVRHFVVRVTTPENPFPPHKHEQGELWYIIEGQAVLTLDGREHAVEGGDLVVLEPWVEHGLRTEGRVTWICIG
ncbi:MAG: cupin domain-containing protein [Chloroflexi bacterium]|nr:cupin domain-containing protein [Chloroflexota bacterium]